jgi:hypothetical protein
MEWVDTIRSKLREMRILSPRENLYTRMPEARLPLAPTRDPNSPLPPPPAGPTAVVPGVEPVRSEGSGKYHFVSAVEVNVALNNKWHCDYVLVQVVVPMELVQ